MQKAQMRQKTSTTVYAVKVTQRHREGERTTTRRMSKKPGEVNHVTREKNPSNCCLDEIRQQSAFDNKLTKKTVERNTRGKQLGCNLNKEGTEAQYKETITSSISIPKPPKTPLKKKQLAPIHYSSTLHAVQKNSTIYELSRSVLGGL